MNYFKFHIGDYIKNTAHLSLLEHGIYFRLLMLYYTRGNPLPSCNSDVHRLIGTLHWRDRSSIDKVLSEFFVLLEDGWHNLRADKEIALDQLFIARQRAAAKAGVDARRGQKDPVDNPAGAQPALSGGSAGGQPPTPTPTPIHTPLPPLEKGGQSQRRSPRRIELDKARVAWSTLIASGGRNRDSRIQAAIDAAGGWLRICARTGRDEKDIRASFCEAYVNAAPRNGASQ